ncbi:squamosa promoter-binding-like protein 7 isoform X3 [Cryptomeria japonica]|uniref:squamosa promoter-binding-like protein 7 isoform X3 n=1 Tax=Cryptomeria japonica TaxID=3369 RepID=UPI0027DA9CD9|nr:squamosa promoter-binding-like protein 7 isoform X3 [Cryptomeria japonica]
MADLSGDPTNSVTWDWENILYFPDVSPSIFPWHAEEQPSANFSEELLAPLETLQILEVQNSLEENRSQDVTEEETASRIRKRDPRLTCENFLAGRVPCACPEMEEIEEEEEHDGSRKRAKVGIVRCQVPSCESDISHLKGYHRRHRVCLSCVNAATVVLDDVPQRYCQQCGKFHLLPDFDEGKRSCRRKLERHNTRRRRKPAGDKASVQGRTSRTKSPLQNADAEPYIYATSAQGRISFKLYDWNPAEFPRRLRQQILQWLANMPIELEGYIRPGCTILTCFIALPQCMWEKLSADATSYICSLLSGSESILSGRGNMLVYLNNIVMQIENGEASVVNTKINQRVPQLYSVHPVFIEAGQPIEIVACGKNLFQSKFRFLISFGGSYLHHHSCEAIPLQKENSNFRRKENTFYASNHESCKIFIPSTDSRLFGPAFIEVENEAGISNFIPILIGDKQICSEFQFLEQELMKCRICYGNGSEDVAITSPSFDMHKSNLVKRQSILDLLLDIAWVIKDPEPEEIEIQVNHAHLQRLNHLFSFLIDGQFLSVMDRLLHSPKVTKIIKQVYRPSNHFNVADVELLYNHVEHAWKSVRKKMDYKDINNFQQFVEKVLLQGQPGNQQPYKCSDESQVIEEIQTGIKSSSGIESGDTRVLSVEENNVFMPLLEKEFCSDISIGLKHKTNLGVQKMIDVVGCAKMLRIDLNRDIRVDRRIFILTITFIAVCAGICVALQHPHQVMKISMSLRRCLHGLHKGQEVASDP